MFMTSEDENYEKISQLVGPVPSYDITIEFMFAGINMFWARIRLILARARHYKLYYYYYHFGGH